jgi:PQQ-dependent dehydrogenase (methanol/ethanol family)
LATLAIGVVAAAAAAAPGDDWPLHGRTAAEDRYSPLADIDRGSVSRLGVAWSHMTGSRRGLEATPIVVEGVLYATASWSIVFALDAATGKELWRYDPKVPGWKARHACCDVVNRGVAYWQGRIYLGALDGRLIALEARTGRLLWEVATTELSAPYTITGAPRVVKGRVIIGNGGADLGVRGFVSAYDAESGELAWRFYTVPRSKDGPHEHPGLAEAAATWSSDSLWESGLGGTVWDSIAYDAELDLLYVGTGNASVYNQALRSPGGGDNLYLASILALRPETGELVWHYQTTPGEQWDYTATQQMVLTDLEIAGRKRKVLLQAPKNGFFYVLDRETGELISAEKYVHVSWATHVDPDTGRPAKRRESNWSQQSRDLAPSIMGGHSWHPMSFHPGTGLVYIPVIESAYRYIPDLDFRFRPGLWNTGEDFAALNEMAEQLGELRFAACGRTRLLAWDPVMARPACEVRHDSGIPGGALATAGGLVFQNSGGGTFSAYDAASGVPLWSATIGVDAMAGPVSYRVAGEQYVAVLAGVGGTAGGHATRFEHDNAGRVIAFKLGGTAPMPPVSRRPAGAVQVDRLDVSDDVITRGRALYGDNCLACHGAAAKSSGLHPDLRFASPETHLQWNAIVLGGLRADRGMASFADALGADDAQAIRAYVLDRAWHDPGFVERMLGLFLDAGGCIPASWITD